MDDEVKITTGEVAVPTIPPEITQPEFLGAENLGPSPIPPGVENKGGALKTILWILAGLVIVGGVGLLGYFVIYPMVFAPQAPADEQPVTTTPPASTHVSFLIAAPAAESEIRLAKTDYLAIAAALQNESFSQLADGQFKEIRISDNQGQVPFSGFLRELAPAFAALGVQDWLDDDFTALLYYDASGVWPIYAARLKAGISPDSVKSSIRQLEGVLDLANFYLASPGSFSQFKDGKVSSYATRYASGSQPGAAFNYGVAGNYLIISTSYSGLKGALPLLGL